MITLLSFLGLNTLTFYFSILFALMLGMLLGWFLWGKYKRRYFRVSNELDDLWDDYEGLKEKISVGETPEASSNEDLIKDISSKFAFFLTLTVPRHDNN